MSELRARWRRWRCDHDWSHTPESGVGFDGASLTARCGHCRRHLLADSNGDWFVISDPEPLATLDTSGRTG